MGELELTLEARDVELPSPRGRLKMIKGGVLLGKSTDINLEAGDFRHSNLIRRMSASDFPAETNLKGVVTRAERKKTTSAEVVKEVLKVTHRNIGEVALEGLFSTVDMEFQEYDALEADRDLGVQEAIASTAEKLAQTDLIKGIDAFWEATIDVDSRLYDATVLGPAKRFAIWLIRLECNEN